MRSEDAGAHGGSPAATASRGGIRLRVLLFGPAREAAGVSEASLVAPPGISVGAAADLLAEAYPSLARHLARCSFALNQEYVSRGAPLADGDQLAIIPPIGGG
jgi:molybdopterin converting factor small subunit